MRRFLPNSFGGITGHWRRNQGARPTVHPNQRFGVWWASSCRPHWRCTTYGKQKSGLVQALRAAPGESGRGGNKRKYTGHCYMVGANKTTSWGGVPKSNRVPTILRYSTLIAVFESPNQDRLGIRLPVEVLSSHAPREARLLVGTRTRAAQIGSFVQYALATQSSLARSGCWSRTSRHTSRKTSRSEQQKTAAR